MKGWLLTNVSNKEIGRRDIGSNLEYLVHVSKVSNITGNKKSLNFNPLYIFKFRCD